MQFDGGSDSQLRALLVTHPADVAQPEEPVRARGGKPRLALVRMESLKVDTERNLDEASSRVGELTRGVVRRDDDHVEGLGQTAVQGADSGGDAELTTHPHRQHVVEAFVAEQDRTDAASGRPAGSWGEGPLVGGLDGRGPETIKDVESTPRRGDHTVTGRNSRCRDLDRDAGLRLRDAVPRSWNDEDTLVPCSDVSPAEGVDGHLHATRNRADEVGELSDTEGRHFSSLCGDDA